ncbi:hypothetical protein [Chroococcidiopsis sp.]|uniref:hypothetical protein n=1 Tax=Chroococcidiopsis sp. TaxID=3088168 RepID=UPI003F3360F6
MVDLRYSTVDRSPQPTELRLGELAVNMVSLETFTVTAEGQVLAINSDRSRLSLFSMFQPNVTLGADTSNFLSFRRTDQGLALTPQTRFISLQDIQGVSIQTPSVGDGIGVYPTGLQNQPLPRFKLGDLADVTFPAVKPAGFVVGFRNDAVRQSTKSPVPLEIAGYWTLLPEQSTLVALDDVLTLGGAAIPPYSVLRNVPPSERRSQKAAIAPLTIEWDRSPALGNSLNAQQHSIVHQVYGVETIPCSTAQCVYTIEATRSSVYRFNCTDAVRTLSIDFTYPFVDPSVSQVRLVSLQIVGLKGALLLPRSIRLENGKPFTITKGTVTLNVMIYTDPLEGLKVVTTQKDVNLRSTQYVTDA